MSATPEAGAWSVDVFEGRKRAVISRPVPLDRARARCQLRLHPLPGATAVHLPIRKDDTVRLRAEIPCAGDDVRITLTLDDSGEIAVTSPLHAVLTLPGHHRHAPVAPLVPSTAAALDVCLLVDGTTLQYGTTSPDGIEGPLLGTSEWADHAAALASVVEALERKYPGPRCTVLVFADGVTDVGYAEDLRPDYLVKPDRRDRRFAVRTTRELVTEVAGLQPTSGADFVDALGYALRECTKLPWRDDARRLLLLTGDSPGLSLLHPAPRGADARARRADVDRAALELHATGVEIMTVYHAPPPGVFPTARMRELSAFARAQYVALASRVGMAYEAATFDAAKAADDFIDATEAAGRGAAYARLLEIIPV